MAIEIKAPTFPESISEGTVAAWHKHEGDQVNQDELLVEVETDKVVLQVLAPQSGVMGVIKIGEGAPCRAEQVLGLLETENKEAKAPFSSAKASVSSEIKPSNQTITINAPVFSESISEGTVAHWYKKVNEPVKTDEPLVSIETDKVTLDIPAPVSGYLVEIKATQGAVIKSAALLATYMPSAVDQLSSSVQPKSIAIATEQTESTNTQSAWLSPAARRLVSLQSADRHPLVGSGKHGTVLKQDLKIPLNNSAPTSEQSISATPTTPIAGERYEQRVPMSRLRQTIAKRLVQAQQNAAMLTTYNEVDMSAVIHLRRQYQDQFQQQHQIKLGFMSFFTKAATFALKRFPDVNASIDGDEIVYHSYQDIGVAISTPRGLVVPILRDTDMLNLAAIERQIADFSNRGKEGKLTLTEMTGGTFTITNGGIFGSLLSTPIINPPQTAILGMHKIQQRPIAIDQQVVIKPMMYLALSYDHRMIDGKDAVQFLVAIKEVLEDPARLLLEI